MADLSAFFPLVAPRLPGVAEVSVEQAALRGAIEFCSATLALQRFLPAVTTVSGQAAYSLTQSGECVDKLLGAKLDGVPLTLLTDEETDEAGLQTAPGTPSHLRLTGVMSVSLYPAPDSAGRSLVVRAAMRPLRSATQVDDDLFERYADAIAHKAVCILASQMGKSYSSGEVAAQADGLFREAVALAKERVFLNNARTRRQRSAQWF